MECFREVDYCSSERSRDVLSIDSLGNKEFRRNWDKLEIGDFFRF